MPLIQVSVAAAAQSCSCGSALCLRMHACCLSHHHLCLLMFSETCPTLDRDAFFLKVICQKKILLRVFINKLIISLPFTWAVSAKPTCIWVFIKQADHYSEPWTTAVGCFCFLLLPKLALLLQWWVFVCIK